MRSDSENCGSRVAVEQEEDDDKDNVIYFAHGIDLNTIWITRRTRRTRRRGGGEEDEAGGGGN